MKKILSFVLVLALLLGMCSITAFAADGKKPEPTTGPADSIFIYGGARCGIYDTHTNKSTNVVVYDYDLTEVAVHNDAIPGMTYDMESNTLTVKDVHQRDNQLYIWYMGNDFKLNVEGENEFGIIYVYNYFNFHGTSLNIVGSGTLTVNEQLINDDAIHMYADGEDPLMGLDIADSVTVHLYSATPEGKDEPAPVVSLNATATTPEQGGAITVGGKALPEAKSEQVKETRPDYVNTIEISNRDKANSRGYQVIRKSDPEGVYAANFIDGAVYYVSRYIYYEDIDMWYVDDSFSYVRYSKEEFAEEFEFVYGDAPTTVNYMDDYVYMHRGDEGVKLSKDGEPAAVYIGVPTGNVWDWGDDYSGNYEIHRVVYDDKQEIYVEDASFEPIDLMANELEAKGYHIEQESHEEQLRLKVWTSPDPTDDRVELNSTVLNRASDPDGIYVQTGTYSSTMNGEVVDEGVSVHKVFYNPETEEHYITYDEYDVDYFYIPYEEFESDECDFSYAYETVTNNARIRYLSSGYNVKYDLTSGILLKEAGKPDIDLDTLPDTVYAYRSWTHYFADDTSREEYALMKMVYNKNIGCYIEDESFDGVEFYDLADLEDMGYEVSMSEQPLDYYVMGSVILSECPVYLDAEGKHYFVDYGNKVYSYSDDNTATLGDTTYYFGTFEPDISVDDLTDTEHEVVTDNYKYWIDGPEYHHEGNAPAGFTVSGKITSYTTTNTASPDVTVVLTGTDNNFTTSVTGTTDYSIENVPAGTYKLTVSKDNHVTRDYEVVVSADTEKNVQICPLGDVSQDGKITSRDSSQAFQYSLGKGKLSEYAVKCGDTVKNDGKIASADASRIYQHSLGNAQLWKV